jgi:hypothetical protein
LKSEQAGAHSTHVTKLKSLQGPLAADLESRILAIRSGAPASEAARGLAAASVAALVALELHPEIVVRHPVTSNYPVISIPPTTGRNRFDETATPRTRCRMRGGNALAAWVATAPLLAG